MIKDEAFVVSSFFFFVRKGVESGERVLLRTGPERLLPERLLPSKIFKKIFSGRGVGWF